MAPWRRAAVASAVALLLAAALVGEWFAGEGGRGGLPDPGRGGGRRDADVVLPLSFRVRVLLAVRGVRLPARTPATDTAV